MYRFYIVPDATTLSSHAAIYEQMELLWDPRAESDAYAVIEPDRRTELNKSTSLEFTVLPENIHYNDFHKKKTVIVAYDDDEWLFEGVVTDAPVDFYKQRKVTCSDPLSYLCDSVQAPDEKNEVSTPVSTGESKYLPVPDSWYSGANPASLSWFERGTDGTFEVTSDSAANADKKYYYIVTGDGTNHSGTTVTYNAATHETLIDHIDRLLTVHNSQVDAFKKISLGRVYSTSDTSVKQFQTSNFRTTWDALKSDVIESYGRYFKIELGADHELYLDYLELSQLEPVADELVPLIEFTNNMIELTESDSSDADIFTVVVPTGKDNLTVSGVSGHNSPQYSGTSREIDPYIVSLGGERRYVVVSRKAISRYGYIIKPQSFSDVEDASTLWSRTVDYIQNNYSHYPEYDAKAIDMRFIDGESRRIVTGGRIRLHSQWHDIDDMSLYVISADNNLANPDNDSYRIGIPTSDFEAKNRKLSSQASSAKSSRARSSAGAASSASALGSILDNYIHVTEWGLEMNSRLKNQVESESQMNLTRFIQDEEHINLAAQKIFGEKQDDNQDAGWIAVPKSEYYKSSNDPSSGFKNPKEQNWYELKGGKYVATNDTVADLNKQYYTMRLWTRYSQIDCGEGGIKATVDGNHERSVVTSSWIESNEDSIIALTGHLHVNDLGEVIVDTGAGFRTGSTRQATDVSYVKVQKVLYGSNSPASSGWYERTKDSAGRWPGVGVAVSEIMAGAAPNKLGPNESKYYVRSTDTTANNSKYYYIRQTTKEEFTAEYGVYDENNLTGGIVARMINTPQYFPVASDVVRLAAKEEKDANALGWYIYNERNFSFELPIAGSKVNASTKYYTLKNVAENWTDIWGEHIVIGKTKGYNGLDAATKARVDKYIADNNLNGTITEIASDVVVVNALIAKYIEADEIIANTSLWAENAYFRYAHIEGEILLTNSDDVGGYETTIRSTLVDTPEVYTDDITFNGVSFGSDSNNTAEDIVMGFGTITTSGDTVTIPYRTAGMDKFDKTHVLSFNKPASLGAVTWSSGNNTLTVETLGGNRFLVGTISNYVPSGSSEASQMANAGYLATETTGYNQVYGLYYKTATGVNAKTMLFKTPRNRYPDAVGTFKTSSNWAKTSSTEMGDGDTINLDFGNTCKIFGQYQTESQFDAGRGATTNLSGVTVKAPAKPSANGVTAASYNNVSYSDGNTISLGYSGSVKVYGRFKLSIDDSYTDCSGITVTAPANNATTISSSDIDIGAYTTYTQSSQPYSTTSASGLASSIKSAINNTNIHWFTFTVTVKGVTKTYALPV